MILPQPPTDPVASCNLSKFWVESARAQNQSPSSYISTTVIATHIMLQAQECCQIFYTITFSNNFENQTNLTPDSGYIFSPLSLSLSLSLLLLKPWLLWRPTFTQTHILYFQHVVFFNFRLIFEYENIEYLFIGVYWSIYMTTTPFTKKRFSTYCLQYLSCISSDRNSYVMIHHCTVTIWRSTATSWDWAFFPCILAAVTSNLSHSRPAKVSLRWTEFTLNQIVADICPNHPQMS